MELLKDFIAVCEKLGLRYYAIGGTALGVVRHGGYIPWDDDIDVAMMREDYEIFLKEGQSLLKDGYFLQTFDTDGFPGNYAKIRDENTTFVETSVEHLPISHGVYIDIFPLDYYPEHSKLFHIMHKLTTVRLGDAYKTKGAKLRTKAVRAILRIIWPSLKKTVEINEKLFTSVKKTNIMANYCGAWGKKEIMPSEWFGEGKKLMFEGMEVNAPDEYDKYLTQMYGDYMQFPPEEQRVGHHYVDAFDADKPYSEYVNF